MVSTPKIERVGELCEHVRKMGKYPVLVEQALKVLKVRMHSPFLSPQQPLIYGFGLFWTFLISGIIQCVAFSSFPFSFLSFEFSNCSLSVSKDFYF